MHDIYQTDNGTFCFDQLSADYEMISNVKEGAEDLHPLEADEDSQITPQPQRYLCSEVLEFWKDLRVDHVQLGLDLVAPDVVGRTDVFVEDQVFRRGRKPAETRLNVKISRCLHGV